MKVHIPAHLRSISKECQLRDWARKNNEKEYFQTIHLIDGRLGQQFGEAFDSEPPVIASLAKTVDREESLYEWVEKLNKDTSSPDQWEQICEAAAMVLWDRYHQAIDGGTWKPETS